MSTGTKKQEDTKGPVCRYCGCGQFRVPCTRPVRSKPIMRRQQCHYGGKRTRAWERVGYWAAPSGQATTRILAPTSSPLIVASARARRKGP